MPAYSSRERGGSIDTCPLSLTSSVTSTVRRLPDSLSVGFSISTGDALSLCRCTPLGLADEVVMLRDYQPLRWRRHFSEQYLTSSQFLAQALRQTISRPQRKQILRGKSRFSRRLGMTKRRYQCDQRPPINSSPCKQQSSMAKPFSRAPLKWQSRLKPTLTSRGSTSDWNH